MHSDSNHFFSSTIIVPETITAQYKIKRQISGASLRKIDAALTRRAWDVLAVIVNELGRPLENIVNTIEKLGEGSFENALNAYLDAYEEDWLINDPDMHALYFPKQA